MSTAVLQAAHLDEWIADSEESYIAIAINQATRLSFLRSNRSFWRDRKVVLWVIHVIYLHPLKKHFLRCA